MVNKCIIRNNFAPEVSVLWAFDLFDRFIIISDSLFELNHGSNSLIEISYSSLNISRCNFSGNLNPTINILKTKFMIANSWVRNSVCSAKQLGCFLVGDEGSTIEIISTEIFNIAATNSESGAIYLKNSNLTIGKGVLFNCTSLGLGSCIFSSFSILNITETNFSNFNPSCIYSDNSQSYFNHIFMGNSFVLNSPLMIKFPKEFVLENSYFSNNSGSIEGGAIFLKNNLFSNNSKSIITSTIFSNNNAKLTGGAINNENQNLEITKSSFQNNSALFGGALYLKNELKNPGNTYLDQINFYLNFAEKEGGALKYPEKWPLFGSIQFEKNLALYGDNYASYPVRIAFKIYDVINSSSKNYFNS